MAVRIDDEPVALEANSLRSLLAAAREHLAPAGRMVVQVQVDGEMVVDEALDSDTPADFSSADVQVYSAKPAELAIGALEQARAMIGGAREQQEQAAELLQKDQTAEALTLVGASIQGWIQAQQAVTAVAQLLGLDLTAITIEGDTVADRTQELLTPSGRAQRPDRIQRPRRPRRRARLRMARDDPALGRRAGRTGRTYRTTRRRLILAYMFGLHRFSIINHQSFDEAMNLDHPTIPLIKAAFSDRKLFATEFRGETTVLVHKDDAHDVLTFLKLNEACRYDFLSDITAVDYLNYPAPATSLRACRPADSVSSITCWAPGTTGPRASASSSRRCSIRPCRPTGSRTTRHCTSSP